MNFKYSVIGDNTEENREHLEKIRYKPNYIYNEDGILYTSRIQDVFMLDYLKI